MLELDWYANGLGRGSYKVIALRVGRRGPLDWILVLVQIVGDKSWEEWVAPSKLRLPGGTFESFLDELEELPGWEPYYRSEMRENVRKGRIIRAIRKRAALAGEAPPSGAGGVHDEAGSRAV
jgi:hypothetical protein